MPEFKQMECRFHLAETDIGVKWRINADYLGVLSKSYRNMEENPYLCT
jgi:hypothetical protein